MAVYYRLKPLLSEIMKPRPILENPNSCGQGTSPLATGHFLAATVMTEGYSYSHSTPIGLPSGDWMLHHTFRNPAHHTASLRSNPETGSCLERWETSCSSASGFHHVGKGMVALAKHLKGKRNRYKFTR